MNARNFLCLCIGTLASLGIVSPAIFDRLIRSHGPFLLTTFKPIDQAAMLSELRVQDPGATGFLRVESRKKHGQAECSISPSACGTPIAGRCGVSCEMQQSALAGRR